MFDPEAGPDHLRKIIGFGGPLNTIINSTFFTGLWHAEDPQVVTYLSSHFDEFLSHAFGTADPMDRALTDRCARLFLTASPRLRDRIYKDTPIFQSTLEYLSKIEAYSPDSHRVFFILFPTIFFTDRGALRPVFSGATIFRRLLSLLLLDSVSRFLDQTVSAPRQSMRPIFAEIELSVILLDNMFSAHGHIRLRSQNLLLHAMNAGVAFGLPDSLIDQNRLSRLINFATESSDPNSFEFLRFVQEYAAPIMFSNGWKTIRNILIVSLNDFCDLVIQSQLFVHTTESCLRLICAIFQSNGQFTPKLKGLLLKLTEMFFNSPRNTFLHNSFVAFLKIVCQKRVFTADLAAEMRIHEQVMACFERKAEMRPVLGQLGQIAKLVDGFAGKAGVDLEVWRNVVMREVAAKERLVGRGYGGSLPRTAREKSTKEMVWMGLAMFVLVLVLVGFFVARTWK
jgi:hypothetical protein